MKLLGKKVELVYLEWFDPESHHEWMALEEAVKKKITEPVFEVGWIIEENDEELTICSQLSGDQAGNRTNIPKSIITKRVVIRRRLGCTKKKSKRRKTS